jgi:hypothetical protein
MVANVEFLRSVREQGGECLAVLVRKGPLSGLTTSSYMQVRYTCMGQVYQASRMVCTQCRCRSLGLGIDSDPLSEKSSRTRLPVYTAVVPR